MKSGAKSSKKLTVRGNGPTNEIVGDVCAVECEDCRLEAGTVKLAVLGIRGIVVKVENGVVTIAKKAWLKKNKRYLSVVNG